MDKIKKFLKENKVAILSFSLKISLAIILYLLTVKTLITLSKNDSKYLIEFVSNDLITTIIGTLLGGYIAFKTAKYTLDEQLRKQSQIEYEKIKLENDIKNIQIIIETLSETKNFLESDFKRHVLKIIQIKKEYQQYKNNESYKLRGPRNFKEELKFEKENLVTDKERLNWYEEELNGLTDISPGTTTVCIEDFTKIIYGPGEITMLCDNMVNELMFFVDNKHQTDLRNIISEEFFLKNFNESIIKMNKIIKKDLPKERTNLVANLGKFLIE